MKKYGYATVFVTQKQWDAQLTRIMQQNLKIHGKSLSDASIQAGDIIAEIQDDRNGMLVIENWRDELNSLYLIPTKTPQELLQEAMVNAVERTRRTGRQVHVVRFTNRKGGVRFKLYIGSTNKAFNDCKIGETIEYLGLTDNKSDSWSKDPLPFWPQSKFKEEFEALPMVREYHISIFGKTRAEWLADKSSDIQH